MSREVIHYRNLTVFGIQIDQTVSVTEYYFPEFSISDFLSNIGGSLGLWLGIGVLQMGGLGSTFVAQIVRQTFKPRIREGSKIQSA